MIGLILTHSHPQAADLTEEVSECYLNVSGAQERPPALMLDSLAHNYIIVD